MTDKSSVQQILGSLIQKPQLLSQVDKYSLTIADFSTRFEKYIFSAIFGLYNQGATKIEAIHMLPGYTHNIINLSDTEDLVTLMWANEQFKPEKPDTFFLEV